MALKENYWVILYKVNFPAEALFYGRNCFKAWPQDESFGQVQN